ncbi:tRNA pseudouridine(13) synthase TruD [Thiohalophilus sp.]|uniref:tRNA pseudouridine(13) synthase TruD n=1 Tax=Thiohalophilus sp. TaxID=3028392 RepID=UPI002ACE44BF|nr:tRNA pseudouridine(13) synthase TruD [Thiohalophilus sp.]MDZ7663161.1 tRNA pseudouridine(13) synthase TruD [Thiohalophilus sp.]
MNLHWSSLAYALGQPTVTGVLRQRVDDFVVEEQLGFEPIGEGQHVWLWIEKRERNTQDIAQLLARHAGVRSNAVGFSGMKDRRAITRQWFSLDLAGKVGPDWSALSDDGLSILQATRHGKKLRRGVHKTNRFEITLRDLQGDTATLHDRLTAIGQSGVPNYFGAQRFGRDEANLDWARRLFAGERINNRNKRSIYLSAARSLLFNQLLSQRVSEGTWQRALEGDVMQLAGSHSIFVPEAIDETIQQRLMEMDIHPTGPLWGRGELKSGGTVKAMEQQLADAYPDYCQGLEQAGLKQERRSLRLAVKQLDWFQQGRQLTLGFELETGAYATGVIRECIDVSDSDH